MPGMPETATMRIDLFLWYARLARSRSIAADLTRSGAMRLDGRRVERAHAPVRVGSVIGYMHGGSVRIVRVVALPQRRGPAAEAAGLYIDLSPVDGPPSAQ